ncbi:hypothetical protein ACJJH9_13960 [Microbulbifer sp. DLAB2-AF]|uniref:hypothetical protein n=1 Tax=Microbulbifer sp. DLAB2-AF TaxID=3243395 RepID=UPI004039B4A6
MKSLLLVILLLSFGVKASVVLPIPISEQDLEGTWHGVDGASLLTIYRLQLSNSGDTSLYSSAPLHGDGMDWALNGRSTLENGKITISFPEKEQIFYRGVEISGRGGCYPEGGSCYLILDLNFGKDNGFTKITFEKIHLNQIKEAISKAKVIFNRFDEIEANKRRQSD